MGLGLGLGLGVSDYRYGLGLVLVVLVYSIGGPRLVGYAIYSSIVVLGMYIFVLVMLCPPLRVLEAHRAFLTLHYVSPTHPLASVPLTLLITLSSYARRSNESLQQQLVRRASLPQLILTSNTGSLPAAVGSQR